MSSTDLDTSSTAEMAIPDAASLPKSSGKRRIGSFVQPMIGNVKSLSFLLPDLAGRYLTRK